jgi:hypothetical protein
MTNNQKILLGVGGLALAYFLYKRNSSGASRQAPSKPPQVGGSPCPDGQVYQVINCIQPPCPPMCVDISKLEATPKPNMPRVDSGILYTCKDGSVQTRLNSDYLKFGKMASPCYNKGGIAKEEKF